MKKVHVIWEDSGYCQAGWQQPDDYMEWVEKKPLMAETTGFMVYKDKAYLVICLSVVKDDEGITEFGEGIKIPMSQVKKIKYIK